MLLKTVLFLCGAVVMSVEILASRTLASEFGSSLHVWGAVIGTFIGALSLGYWLGGVASDRWPTRLGLAAIVSASGILITVTVPFARRLNTWVAMRDMPVDVAVWLKPLLATTIIYFVPVVLLGAVSPYSVRLAARDLTRLGKKVGGFYAISSLGSIVGTFFTAFYLIAKMRGDHIILAEGFLLIALAIPIYLAGFFFEGTGPQTGGN